jgi:molybdopterin-guanine dinucleotide biosynthesis protein A
MSDAVNADAAQPLFLDRDFTLGLILNGGLARRMGGADKGLLALAGRPMLARVIERLRPQCAELAISANGDPARFAPFGLPVVADDPPDFSGPLAGVLAGLDFCARRAPRMTHVATLPVDTPFAPQDFVAQLHAARRASGAAIAVAASGGRTHHVAALWPVALVADLRRALAGEGMRKVESFLARFSVAVVEWPCEPVDPFFNVNAAEDLARAEALVRGSSGGAP